jgi:hypothetical protein
MPPPDFGLPLVPPPPGLRFGVVGFTAAFTGARENGAFPFGPIPELFDFDLFAI